MAKPVEFKDKSGQEWEPGGILRMRWRVPHGGLFLEKQHIEKSRRSICVKPQWGWQETRAHTRDTSRGTAFYSLWSTLLSSFTTELLRNHEATSIRPSLEMGKWRLRQEVTYYSCTASTQTLSRDSKSNTPPSNSEGPDGGDTVTLVLSPDTVVVSILKVRKLRCRVVIN